MAGLSDDRGTIEVGKVAHLTVFDPEATKVAERLLHRHSGSPYEGKAWKGVVEATYLHGAKVFDGSAVADVSEGRLVLSTTSASIL